MTSNPLTSSAEDSPAKTLATPARAPDYQESVLVCGEKCYEPFAWYDHASHLWRTWQLCLGGGWAEFSETWPRAGMTQNGIAYRRVPLVRLTGEKESFLLPTMRASMSLVGATIYNRSPNHGNLEEIIAELHLELIGQKLSIKAGERHMGFPIGWTNLTASETQ